MFNFHLKSRYLCVGKWIRHFTVLFLGLGSKGRERERERETERDRERETHTHTHKRTTEIGTCRFWPWAIEYKKLENCVCKTQVMPPCPKPVLTPCPILTHDPQHIQSILETNVWNVKVKIAVILSKIIILCAKTHAHLQYVFNSCAKFQNECLKTLRGDDYTILLPLTET